ncbi:abortive infection family protein [Ruegeria sp. HKCCD6428]|uniref:abortive infection family protein n=1 Tax=Ruegeria sp. HKCCD6428 TaxID=2683002 RepID=UPI00149161BE|nr:abortive infection family protein [Ruegeria sp. HKCCD6428]NOC83331.1 hypothetical protein [Ruegeria sp. HKCCD6428]
MKLSSNGRKALVDIITGNTEVSPYRSGPELIEFFHDFGERDLYGQGFPARAGYCADKLDKLNGSAAMQGVILAAFDFLHDERFNAEDEARKFNKLLARDGFRLVIEYGPGRMQGDTYERGEPYFDLQSLTAPTLAPEALAAISHAAVNEQITKANRKLETGDFAGAIASAYTLVEELLKHMLRAANTDHKETDGDIRSLYKAVRAPLGLDPSADSIDKPLQPILTGFQQLVTGLFEISNKASDRHARKYHPAGHHARLATNAAFALCDFLVESFEYQKQRNAKPHNGDSAT